MCKNFTHEQRAECTHADADGRASWQRTVAVCWTARVCTTVQSSSCTPLPQLARGQLSTGAPLGLNVQLDGVRKMAQKVHKKTSSSLQKGCPSSKCEHCVQTRQLKYQLCILFCVNQKRTTGENVRNSSKATRSETDEGLDEKCPELQVREARATTFRGKGESLPNASVDGRQAAR